MYLNENGNYQGYVSMHFANATVGNGIEYIVIYSYTKPTLHYCQSDTKEYTSRAL